MTEEDFISGLDDLIGMLKSFRQIKDRGRKRWLRTEIRNLLRLLMKE